MSSHMFYMFGADQKVIGLGRTSYTGTSELIKEQEGENITIPSVGLDVTDRFTYYV